MLDIRNDEINFLQSHLKTRLVLILKRHTLDGVSLQRAYLQLMAHDSSFLLLKHCKVIFRHTQKSWLIEACTLPSDGSYTAKNYSKKKKRLSKANVG